MLKNFWHRLTKNSSGKATDKNFPVILARKSHSVSRRKMSKNALKVLNRLNNAGYQAYLVGGGVRDILLGLSPKDFDIATDATPEQIKREFKNCRLIGRRFRLAHILYGREVIEVATFRANHEDSPDRHARTSEQGLLVRDNVFGNIEEDAFRRDFTVNALYYSAKDFTLLDHVGGLADLEKRQLRLIGDPVTRYREDPVRILRAIRLSCKLELNIESATAAPIKELSELLEHISPARLWDESNKLFLSGHARKIWQALLDYEVLPHLFKTTFHSLNHDKNGEFNAFIHAALESTDRRILKNMPVTPAFLFAVFLWQPMRTHSQNLLKKNYSLSDASQKAANQVFDEQRKTIAIPKRFTMTVREIWDLQHRLTNRRRKSVDTIMQHPKFRAAYDFLCLRALNDNQLSELARWWTDYQDASQEERYKLIKNVNQSNPQRKSKNKRSSKFSRGKAKNNE